MYLDENLIAGYRPCPENPQRVRSRQRPICDRHHITEYVSHSSSMKQLRSASYLIRENGLIVGMLASTQTSAPSTSSPPWRINSPGSTRPHSAPQATTAILTPLKSRASPTLPKTLSSAPSRASPRRAAVFSPDKLSQSDRVEIIRDLNNNGMFLLKGAVATVAEVMGVSEPSVYRYLQKVKKEL